MHDVVTGFDAQLKRKPALSILNIQTVERLPTSFVRVCVFPLLVMLGVFLPQDSDRAWNSKLTPMTRLFMMAGLTSVGVRAVHFIDGNHASFSFSPSPTDGDERNTGEGEDKEEAGSLRGGRPASGRPEAGQVGVLRLDDVGRRDQFIVTTEQPLPDKLTVSAPLSPARPRGATSARGSSGGGFEGGMGRGRSTAVCQVRRQRGKWGQERANWFPGEDDPRELVRALDNFCPISWLRKEQQERREGAGGAVNSMTGIKITVIRCCRHRALVVAAAVVSATRGRAGEARVGCSRRW